jgi:hypothetical protein
MDREILPHSKKLCFYSMEIGCMERLKDKLSKEAKVLKE